MSLVDKFNSQTNEEKLQFLALYLPRVCKSLKVANIKPCDIERSVIHEWKKRASIAPNWDARSRNWNTERTNCWLDQLGDGTYRAVTEIPEDPLYRLPIFLPWALPLIPRKEEETTTTPKKEEEPTMIKQKLTIVTNTVVSQHKEAAKLTAKLTVGRAANTFIMEKLVKLVPWYKRRAIKKNPMLKLLTAEIANLAAQATNNSKLALVGDAMLQEAMVDGVVYSDVLSNLIKSLESAVDTTVLEKLIK